MAARSRNNRRETSHSRGDSNWGILCNTKKVNSIKFQATAIKNESESTSGRHSRVDLGGVSTANSKAKVFPAQLYITSAI